MSPLVSMVAMPLMIRMLGTLVLLLMPVHKPMIPKPRSSRVPAPPSPNSTAACRPQPHPCSAPPALDPARTLSPDALPDILKLQVTSDYVENLGGSSQFYTWAADGSRVIALVQGRHTASKGSALELWIAPSKVYLFDAQGQAL